MVFQEMWFPTWNNLPWKHGALRLFEVWNVRVWLLLTAGCINYQDTIMFPSKNTSTKVFKGLYIYVHLLWEKQIHVIIFLALTWHRLPWWLFLLLPLWFPSGKDLRKAGISPETKDGAIMSAQVKPATAANIRTRSRRITKYYLYMYCTMSYE